MAKRIGVKQDDKGTVVIGTEYGGPEFAVISDVFEGTGRNVYLQVRTTTSRIVSRADIIRVTEKALQTMNKAFKFNSAVLFVEARAPLVTVEERYGCPGPVKVYEPDSRDPVEKNTGGENYPTASEDGIIVQVYAMKKGICYQQHGGQDVQLNIEKIFEQAGVSVKN